MTGAKYIGRVGGLAVALGVGIAVATTPGVASADDTGPSSPAGSTGAEDASAKGAASNTPGRLTTPGNAVEPRAPSIGGSPKQAASAPRPGSVSTGGASAKSKRETPVIGDVA